VLLLLLLSLPPLLLWWVGERSCGEQANQRAGDPAGFCWLLAVYVQWE
jgi:hypothetical protein